MKLKYSAKAHGYWLNGKRCKSPSAIAKVPDDSSALDFWRRRQTAIGLALQPHLLTSIAAAADDKRALDDICEEAMNAAGASSGRDYGTAVHKITDLLDGGDFVLETPEVIAIRKTWRTLLDSHDLEVVASEQVVVHPDLMIAGRFDRVVRHRASGRLFILDTKTGKSAADFLQAHAVQLWLYASAPLCADGPTGDTDFEVSAFVPMHAVDQSVALVAHLPMGGEASIIGIDIAAGGRCFTEVIQPTWAWRSRTDLRVDGWSVPTFTEPASDVAFSPLNAALTANLIKRLRAVAVISSVAASQVRANWPAGVPKLSDGGHVEDDLKRIEALVQWAETQVSAPFADLPAEAPAKPSPDVAAVVAVRVQPAEGAELAASIVTHMRNQYEWLTDAQRNWIARLATESRVVATFHMTERTTERSGRIAGALMRLATWLGDDLPAGDAVVRALVSAITNTDEPLQPALPTGAAVAVLDADEALRLRALATELIEGRLALAPDDDGVLRVSAEARLAMAFGAVDAA